VIASRIVPAAVRRLGWAALVLACGALLFRVAGAAGGLATAAGLAAALLPDLALLRGAEPGLARGQLAPRAVPLYNAVHAPWGPLAALAAGLALGSAIALAAGLGWALHVALDRSLGYGPRTPAGFQRA
jgi:uncharacterized protein DUF4260